MSTAFGPQGYNAATTLPPGGNTNRYGEADTWVRDCTPGDNNGTVLNAAFFNMIIGNLRTVVTEANNAGANIALTDGDMTLLSQAIVHFASQNAYTGGSGIEIDGTARTITLDLSGLTGTTPDPANDQVALSVAATGNVASSTPYDLVDSVVEAGTNITATRNAVTGRINLSVAAALTAGLVQKTGDTMTGDLTVTGGDLITSQIAKLGSYTPGTLPAAGVSEAGIAYCTTMPGAGGSEGIVFSDGTNWRKISNSNIIA